MKPNEQKKRQSANLLADEKRKAESDRRAQEKAAKEAARAAKAAKEAEEA